MMSKLSGLYLWQIRHGIASEIINVLATDVSDAVEKACRAVDDCTPAGISEVKKQELWVYYDCEERS